MGVLESGAVPALFADGFVFGEGPRWREGTLWLSDIHGEAVYSVAHRGDKTLRLALPGKKPSGLGFLPDGSVLVVSMTDRLLLRLAPDGLMRKAALQGRRTGVVETVRVMVPGAGLP